MLSRKKLVIILFICLALIQLYIPVSSILRYELTYKYGQQFKFKAAPVDPYDPFRGRYVSIRIGNAEVPIPENLKIREKQTVYVEINQDEKGFAKLSGIYTAAPKSNVYFKTKISHIKLRKEGEIAVVDIPFDHYYMEEKSAPAAENAYLKNANNNVDDVYVTVRVMSGLAILEKLYIKGIPVEEYLKTAK